ncbi:DUF349 domain-containing protein [Flavobacteriales bacterium]|nr:DUF349 domain-containing protein [Flavobacteriales bacterium]
MKRNKQNSDLKKNHELKVNLIKEIKSLLDSSIDNDTKYGNFLGLRKKWINIGKVPGHLAFGLNNSYSHQVKVFYDYLYLDKKFKNKDQANNKKIKEQLILDASKIEKFADKLKGYRELLFIIRKWNYQVGPVKPDDEKKLELKFDIIIKNIKNQKKYYLNNRDKFDKENLEHKKELIKRFKDYLENLPNEKNKWIKMIDEIAKIKDTFINIGPIKLSENDKIWDEFKALNRKFIKEKNLYFKKLKKNYSFNIEKQLEIINKLKSYINENDKINKKIITEIRNDFKTIKDVPFKKNKENWLIFNEIYNSCINKVNSSKFKDLEIQKDILKKQRELKEELLLNFDVEKIDSTLDKWLNLGKTKSIKETNELIAGIEEKIKSIGLKNRDNIILEIKSKILDENIINSEKIKLKKKIEDYEKQISQLENNLNFIKGNSESGILSNVHSNIENYKSQIKKLQKNLKLFSKG